VKERPRPVATAEIVASGPTAAIEVEGELGETGSTEMAGDIAGIVAEDGEAVALAVAVEGEEEAVKQSQARRNRSRRPRTYRSS
jgi:hypothetical protein